MFVVQWFVLVALAQSPVDEIERITGTAEAIDLSSDSRVVVRPIHALTGPAEAMRAKHPLALLLRYERKEPDRVYIGQAGPWGFPPEVSVHRFEVLDSVWGDVEQSHIEAWRWSEDGLSSLSFGGSDTEFVLVFASPFLMQVPHGLTLDEPLQPMVYAAQAITIPSSRGVFAVRNHQLHDLYGDLVCLDSEDPNGFFVACKTETGTPLEEVLDALRQVEGAPCTIPGLP